MKTGLKITIQEVEAQDLELNAEVEINYRPIEAKKATRFYCFSAKEAQRALNRAVDAHTTAEVDHDEE